MWINTLKIKYILLLIFLFGINFCVISQSNIIYSRFDVYEFAVNPAISGRDYYPLLNLSFKKQWFGISQSPYTTGIGGYLRMGTFDFYRTNKMLNKSIYKNKGRIGLGGLLLNDKNGPLKTANYQASVSYFIPFKESELSFGLSARLNKYSIDYAMLEPEEMNDPAFLNSQTSSLCPDFDAGVYYHAQNFYTGISINDLIKNQKLFIQTDKLKNYRDVFFLSGYKFINLYFDVEPTVYLGLIDKDEIYYNFKIKLYYKTYNWISFSYKMNSIACLSIGTKLRKAYFVYSYEQNISQVAKSNFGTHELMLGLNIGLFEVEGIRKRVK